MLRKIIFGWLFVAMAIGCGAQDEAAPSPQAPQVKVHMLNVCSPSPEEQQEISSALANVPKRPSFSDDFEVDRGRSILDPSANPLLSGHSEVPAETTVADFVRLRREVGSGVYSTVQYSFSRDTKQMVETLVFRVRDPKTLLQLSIDDSASSVTKAAAMLGSATPAARIKLERFGKSSVVLARCSGTPDSPPPDQHIYEPLFASASAVLSNYRGLLGTRTLVPEELTRLDRGGTAALKRPGTKSNAAKHP